MITFAKQISDKVGQLEAYKREIANLKAALLEARGGQLMTAGTFRLYCFTQTIFKTVEYFGTAGETITAEELISKMKEIQEEREQQVRDIFFSPMNYVLYNCRING